MGQAHNKQDTHDMPGVYGMHSLEFRLPDLGEGLTEAEIVHWLVEVGDFVTVDQPVVEVETAKATVEVPCPYSGVVTARFGEEGTELPVGSPLLTVAVGQTADGARGAGGEGNGKAGRDWPGGQDGDARPQGRTGRDAVAGRGAGAAGPDVDRSDGAQSGARPAADEGSGNVLVGYGTTGAQARRRRVRPPATGSSWTTRGTHGGVATREDDGHQGADEARAGGATGTGSGARPGGDAGGFGAPAVDADADAALASGPVPVISPLVRKLARDHGIDLHGVIGSGPDGLIMRADVEHAVRAAASARTTSAAPAPGAVAAGLRTGTGAAGGAGAGAGLRLPLRGVRGAIADKMTRSRREIPDATCWVDADATELLNARAVMNAAGGPKISVLALLARVCTAALARYPELNSTVDVQAREIVRLDRVHLGFAAQTERGLVVPVVRDAQERDAESLSAEFTRLTEAARSGTLTPGELTGGTFTLNNYGVFGVDGSTPIINHPEAAMLGVGRISPKPWVHRDELAVRQVVQLSLTFDHRVCDGGAAGGFLRYVADCVEQPALLLRSV